jgi:multidrug efflux pump subunit AcrA (membrane-fusion protein)
MRKVLGRFFLPFLAAAMLVFAVVHVVRTQQTPPRPPPPVEPPRTPFGRTVAGAGIVEARTENVSVGTALPGLVLEVYVPTAGPSPGEVHWQPGDPQDLIGKTVRKGDPLFLVDNRQLKAQLDYQKANLAAARAQLAKLDAQPRPEELPSSEAKVKTAEANLQMQEDLAARARRLIGSRVVSEEDYRQRTLAAAMARQQLAQAQADYDLLKAGAWEPDKAIARAAIRQAEAQVLQVQTDLDRALVRAPLDGKVLQVNVRPGEYVGTPPGQALIVLGDISKRVHVRVDIDEHDIPRFKPGAPARASLRGTPDVSYPLQFVRVEPYVIPKKSLTGDNTERVDTRVLQVIYALDATGRPIYVGQQMDVFLDVGDPAARSAETRR